MSSSVYLPPALPSSSQMATKYIVEFIVDSLWPTTLGLKNKFLTLLRDTENNNMKQDLMTLKDVFSLCCSQIQKCMIHFLEIFRMENQNNIFMQESRNCTLDRLSWCLKKLNLINDSIGAISLRPANPDESKRSGDALDNSLLATTMYFVNWIDRALELLTSLSTLVYQSDNKEPTESNDTWLNEVIETVSGLHTTIDEVLLSALTLSRYCLPEDKNVFTVRCQVVLREAKKLISEIIKGDVDKAYVVTKDSLKLPLKPTNINVFVDVLKETLYTLETHTNTSLLALLVHCFTDVAGPLKGLENHFKGSGKVMCGCGDGRDVDDCSLVEQFDLYNERLMQIGGFSISCSSDENRILSLKSCLASLEALEPHLVPAVMMGPSPHARFLTSAWSHELRAIRDNVFLIVDPAAFSTKVKETMHKILLDLIKGKTYVKKDICSVIDMGALLLDFFMTYNKQEPEALLEYDKLELLLQNLGTVLKECKMVNTLYDVSARDSKYDLEIREQQTISFDKVVKRLKLLFTITSRINSLFLVNEENGVFDDENTEPNLDTFTVDKKRDGKPCQNTSRIPFGRELSIQRYNPSKCIITKMAKNFSGKQMNKELSFSVQLDELFLDVSPYKNKKNVQECTTSSESKNKSTSILYSLPIGSKRDSIRKAMMRKKFGVLKEVESKSISHHFDPGNSVTDSSAQFQITEILDQMTDLSRMLDVEAQEASKKTVININSDSTCVVPTGSNVLKLSINSEQNVKNVWNIPINFSMDDTRPSEMSSNSSTPSNVTTLERLCDIDMIENRLNELKHSDV